MIQNCSWKKDLVKISAVAVCFVFSTTTIAWSTPQVPSIQNFNPNVHHAVSPIEHIEIPAHLGLIRDRYVPVEKTRFTEEVRLEAAPAVVHIEDAHSHEEAQQNIKKILEHLTEDYHPDVIFLEGAAYEIRPDLLRFFESEDWNIKNAELLLKESLIGGTELFALTHKKQNIAVYGIEDPELYRPGLEAYKRVMTGRKETARWLEQFKGEWNEKTSKAFSKPLADFFRDWLFYQDNSAELLRHIESLARYAKETLSLDLHHARNQINWPQLVRIIKLGGMEKEQNPEALKKETEQFRGQTAGLPLEGALLEILTGKTPKDLSVRKTVEKFYEDAGKQNFTFRAYPEISRMLGIKILYEELNAQLIVREAEKLSGLLISRLSVSEEEKNLTQLYRDYLLVKKLLNLEIVDEDHRQILAMRRTLNPSEMIRRLERAGEKSQGKKLPSLNPIFHDALRFYHLAVRREKIMVDKMTARMKEEGRYKAVLITGGFHSTGLAKLFQTHAIPYLRVTPKISEPGTSEAYIDIMTGRGDYLTRRSYYNHPSIADGQGLLSLGQTAGEFQRTHMGALLHTVLSTIMAERVGQGEDFSTLLEEINQSTAVRGHTGGNPFYLPSGVFVGLDEPIPVIGKKDRYLAVSPTGPSTLASSEVNRIPSIAKGQSAVKTRSEVRTEISTASGFSRRRLLQAFAGAAAAIGFSLPAVAVGEDVVRNESFRPANISRLNGQPVLRADGARVTQSSSSNFGLVFDVSPEAVNKAVIEFRDESGRLPEEFTMALYGVSGIPVQVTFVDEAGKKADFNISTKGRNQNFIFPLRQGVTGIDPGFDREKVSSIIFIGRPSPESADIAAQRSVQVFTEGLYAPEPQESNPALHTDLGGKPEIQIIKDKIPYADVRDQMRGNTEQAKQADYAARPGGFVRDFAQLSEDSFRFHYNVQGSRVARVFSRLDFKGDHGDLSQGYVFGLEGPQDARVQVEITDANNRAARYLVTLTGNRQNYSIKIFPGVHTGLFDIAEEFDASKIAHIDFILTKDLTGDEQREWQGNLTIISKGLGAAAPGVNTRSEVRAKETSVAQKIRRTWSNTVMALRLMGHWTGIVPNRKLAQAARARKRAKREAQQAAFNQSLVQLGKGLGELIEQAARNASNNIQTALDVDGMETAFQEGLKGKEETAKRKRSEVRAEAERLSELGKSRRSFLQSVFGGLTTAAVLSLSPQLMAQQPAPKTKVAAPAGAVKVEPFSAEKISQLVDEAKVKILNRPTLKAEGIKLPYDSVREKMDPAAYDKISAGTASISQVSSKEFSIQYDATASAVSSAKGSIVFENEPGQFPENLVIGMKGISGLSLEVSVIDKNGKKAVYPVSLKDRKQNFTFSFKSGTSGVEAGFDSSQVARIDFTVPPMPGAGTSGKNVMQVYTQGLYISEPQELTPEFHTDLKKNPPIYITEEKIPYLQVEAEMEGKTKKEKQVSYLQRAQGFVSDFVQRAKDSIQFNYNVNGSKVALVRTRLDFKANNGDLSERYVLGLGGPKDVKVLVEMTDQKKRTARYILTLTGSEQTYVLKMQPGLHTGLAEIDAEFDPKKISHIDFIFTKELTGSDKTKSQGTFILNSKGIGRFIPNARPRSEVRTEQREEPWFHEFRDVLRTGGFGDKANILLPADLFSLRIAAPVETVVKLYADALGVTIQPDLIQQLAAWSYPQQTRPDFYDEAIDDFRLVRDDAELFRKAIANFRLTARKVLAQEIPRDSLYHPALARQFEYDTPTPYTPAQLAVLKITAERLYTAFIAEGVDLRTLPGIGSAVATLSQFMDVNPILDQTDLAALRNNWTDQWIQRTVPSSLDLMFEYLLNRYPAVEPLRMASVIPDFDAMMHYNSGITGYAMPWTHPMPNIFVISRFDYLAQELSQEQFASVAAHLYATAALMLMGSPVWSQFGYEQSEGAINWIASAANIVIGRWHAADHGVAEAFVPASGKLGPTLLMKLFENGEKIASQPMNTWAAALQSYEFPEEEMWNGRGALLAGIATEIARKVKAENIHETALDFIGYFAANAKTVGFNELVRLSRKYIKEHSRSEVRQQAGAIRPELQLSAGLGALTPGRSEVRSSKNEKDFNRKYKEQYQGTSLLYGAEIPTHLGGSYRRIYDAVAGLFGVNLANEQERIQEGKRLLYLLYQQTNKDQLIDDAIQHLQNYTFVASGAHRFASIGLAIENQFRGRNIFAGDDIESLQSIHPGFEYLKDFHPFYTTPEVYGVARPAHLPSLVLEKPLEKSTYRLLDIGSAPKHDGAPTLNLLSDLFSRDNVFQGKSFEILGTDVFFPLFEERKGKVFYRQEQSISKRTGEVEYYNVNQPNNAGEFIADVMRPDFEKGRLGKFDFITVSATLHHLMEKKDEEYGEFPLANVPLKRPDGTPFQEKYYLAQSQFQVVTRLLNALTDRGVLFLNFTVVWPGMEPEELAAQPEILKKFFEQHFTEKSNSDTFVVIQRVGSDFIIHDQVIPFRPGLEKEGSGSFLLKGKIPFFTAVKITDLYPTVEEDGKNYQKIKELYTRADMLVYWYQGLNQSRWGSMKGAADLMKPGVSIPEILKAYMQYVSDAEPLKAPLLADAQRLHQSLQVRSEVRSSYQPAGPMDWELARKFVDELNRAERVASKNAGNYQLRNFKIEIKNEIVDIFTRINRERRSIQIAKKDFWNLQVLLENIIKGKEQETNFLYWSHTKPLPDQLNEALQAAEHYHALRMNATILTPDRPDLQMLKPLAAKVDRDGIVNLLMEISYLSEHAATPQIRAAADERFQWLNAIKNEMDSRSEVRPELQMLAGPGALAPARSEVRAVTPTRRTFLRAMVTGAAGLGLFLPGSDTVAQQFQLPQTNPLLDREVLYQAYKDIQAGMKKMEARDGLPVNQINAPGAITPGGWIRSGDFRYLWSSKLALVAQHGRYPVGPKQTAASDPKAVTAVIKKSLVQYSGLMDRFGVEGILPESLVYSENGSLRQDPRDIEGVGRGIVYAAYDDGLTKTELLRVREIFKGGIIPGLEDPSIVDLANKILERTNYHKFIDGVELHSTIVRKEDGSFVQLPELVDNKNTEALLFLPLIAMGHLGNPRDDLKNRIATGLDIWRNMYFHWIDQPVNQETISIRQGDAGGTAWAHLYLMPIDYKTIAPNTIWTGQMNYLRAYAALARAKGHQTIVSSAGTGKKLSEYGQYGLNNPEVMVTAGPYHALIVPSEGTIRNVETLIRLGKETGSYRAGWGHFDAVDPKTGAAFPGNQKMIYMNLGIMMEALAFSNNIEIEKRMPYYETVVAELKRSDEEYDIRKKEALKKMTAAQAEKLASTVPLTEAGYWQISESGHVAAMIVFIRRIAEITNEGELAGLAPFFTSKVEAVSNPEPGKGAQTLRRLKVQLREKSWATIRGEKAQEKASEEKPGGTKNAVQLARTALLNEPGYKQVAETGDVSAMKIYIERIAVISDQGQLSGLVPFYTKKVDGVANPEAGESIQSYEKLIQELKTKPWAKLRPSRSEVRFISAEPIDVQIAANLRNSISEFAKALKNPARISAMTKDEIATGRYSFQLTRDTATGDFVIKVADFGSAEAAKIATSQFKELGIIPVEDPEGLELARGLGQLITLGQELIRTNSSLQRDPVRLAEAVKHEIQLALGIPLPLQPSPAVQQQTKGISAPRGPPATVSQRVMVKEALNYRARMDKINSLGAAAKKQIENLTEQQKLQLVTQMALDLKRVPIAAEMAPFQGSKIGVKKVSEFPEMGEILRKQNIPDHFAGYIEITEQARRYMVQQRAFKYESTRGFMNDPGIYGPEFLRGSEVNYFREVGSYLYMAGNWLFALHESFHHRAGGKTDQPFVNRISPDDMNLLEEMAAYRGMNLRSDGTVSRSYIPWQISEIQGYTQSNQKRSEVRLAITAVERLDQILPAVDVTHILSRARSLQEVVELGQLSEEDLIDRFRPGFTKEELQRARQAGYDAKQKAVFDLDQEARARDYITQSLLNEAPGKIQQAADRWALPRVRYLVETGGRSEIRLLHQWMELEQADEILMNAAHHALAALGIRPQDIRAKVQTLEGKLPIRSEVKDLAPETLDAPESVVSPVRSEVKDSAPIQDYFNAYGVRSESVLSISRDVAQKTISDDHRIRPEVFMDLVDAVAGQIAEERRFDLAQYRSEINETIESITKLMADGRLNLDGKGVAVLTTAGNLSDRTALILAAIPIFIALAKKDSRGQYTGSIVLGGKQAEAIKQAVYTKQSGLTEEEKSLVGNIVRFSHGHVAMSELIREEYARESRKTEPRSVISSLTSSENSETDQLITQVLRAIENPGELHDIQVKSPVKRAEAYAVRALMLIDLASRLRIQAEKLKEQPDAKAELVRLIRQYFETNLPDIVVAVNGDGSFNLSLAAISRQLAVFKAAAEARERSA